MEEAEFKIFLSHKKVECNHYKKSDNNMRNTNNLIANSGPESTIVTGLVLKKVAPVICKTKKWVGDVLDKMSKRPARRYCFCRLG